MAETNKTQLKEMVELPKDCNGLYLHIGDAVRDCGEQTVYRINSMRLEQEGWMVMYSVTGDNRGLYGRWSKDLIRLDTRVKKVYKNAYGDMVLMTSNNQLVEEIWSRHNKEWSLFAGYSTDYGCDYLVIPQRLWDECGQTVEGLLA